MQDIVFKCPVNNVSFGNVSLNILREMFNRGMRVAHFPIGNPDAAVYDKLSPEFRQWLQDCINNRFKVLNKDLPTLQLWHINGSENRITSKQYLITFYEVDSPTLVEKNLVLIHLGILAAIMFHQFLWDLIPTSIKLIKNTSKAKFTSG